MNIFQRLIRQWEMLHPYNAGQIMKLAGTPDVAAIQSAWRTALADAGLGWVRVDGSQYRYEPLNGEVTQWPVQLVPAGTQLEEWVEQEMNRPFDDGREPPFRPFILPGEGSYHFGVFYHHWIGDSVSIRLLLRQWFLRMFDPRKADRPRIRLVANHWPTMSPDAARWSIGQGLLSAISMSARSRRTRRLKDKGIDDLTAAFLFRQCPEGWIDQMHQRVRRRGIKLNDLFLAAMARACYDLPAHFAPRRQDLALGTIVDLRPFSQHDLSSSFGMFLGFTTVVCRPDDLRDSARLLRSIAAQTAMHKEEGMAQASCIRMLAGLAVGSFAKPAKVVRFYQKRVPLAGGISNINLNRSWVGECHPQPLLDYVRISPTGPMSPLVFSTTTLGAKFNFGLTYRPSLVPAAEAARIADRFIQSATELASAL